jgi:hypothetical protein
MADRVGFGRARLVAAGAALLFVWMSLPAGSQSSSSSAPSFLQPGRCYRFTFPITGAPNWKVLDVLDAAGWIKAEVDAGAASAKRESAWINTAQLITVRESRCSGE